MSNSSVKAVLFGASFLLLASGVTILASPLIVSFADWILTVPGYIIGIVLAVFGVVGILITLAVGAHGQLN